MQMDRQHARANALLITLWFILTIIAIAVPPLFLIHLIAIAAIPVRRRNERLAAAQKRNNEAVHARQSRGY